MTAISFWDLKQPDHPAVQRALQRKCGICDAPKGEFCRSLSEGYKTPTLVHFSRATAHYETEARKKREAS